MLQTAIVLLFLFLAGPSLLYRGEVDLPEVVFTPDGKSVPPGKHALEVRTEDGHYALVISGPEKQSIALDGVPFSTLGPFVQPVVGVVLLWPAAEPAVEDTKSKISPYLTNVDWRATLRIYQSSNPQDEEIRAVLADGPKRMQFTLFRSKPPKPAAKP
jgi:hypothetical protein